MKLNSANKFLVLGLLIYLIAGIMFISKMDYSVVIILAAIIFLALGFFTNVKLKWFKLFKKKA